MFTYPSVDFEHAGESGYVTIEPTVEGFWSSPITLRIQRNWHGENNLWNFDISHSSGGYEGDDKFPAGRLVAESNFAMCILEGIKVLEELKSKTDIFEANYQRGIAERKAAEERARKEKEDRLAKDPGFTKAQAEAIVLQMQAELKTNYRSDTRRFFHRDSDNKIAFMAEKFDVKTVFKVVSRWDSRRISKKDLIEALMDVSANRKVEAA